MPGVAGSQIARAVSEYRRPSPWLQGKRALGGVGEATVFSGRSTLDPLLVEVQSLRRKSDRRQRLGLSPITELSHVTAPFLLMQLLFLRGGRPPRPSSPAVEDPAPRSGREALPKDTPAQTAGAGSGRCGPPPPPPPSRGLRGRGGRPPETPGPPRAGRPPP